VGGRPPVPRRHGRGTARSGEDAAWEAGAVVLERSGRPCDTARMAWDRGQSARGRGNSPGGHGAVQPAVQAGAGAAMRGAARLLK
jgi:hypothetical protein